MYVNNITSDHLIIKSPAKINLFLEVLNKRPDGFHNINSAFQAVSLFDELDIKVTDQPGIEIEIINNRELTVGEDNLITKAYRLMVSKFQFKKGLKVNLTKNIPISAGLGGGSGNAAALIWACNILFNLDLTSLEMSKISEEIGSDIPFFFFGGQALVTGRGEVVEPLELPLDYQIVLVNPRLAVSTPESFAALKRGLTKTKNPFKLSRCRTVDELVCSIDRVGNDFEEILRSDVKDIFDIKDGLDEIGAKIARMSGSGPTMFGIFDRNQIVNVSDFSAGRNWLVYTVKPIAYRC